MNADAERIEDAEDEDEARDEAKCFVCRYDGYNGCKVNIYQKWSWQGRGKSALGSMLKSPNK